MKTIRRSMLGCVVVLLVAGIVSFPKTAFGLEVVVGCAGAPTVTGSAAVRFTMADGQQWNFPTTCTSDGRRHASTSNNTISSAQVTGWTVTQMSVNGENCMDDITSSGTSLPARFTCKHPTDNVRLHVTVK
jgi:hypothetical protein